MWPPSFLDDIEKQMQTEPNRPVLDNQWILTWKLAHQECTIELQTAFKTDDEQATLWRKYIDQLNSFKEKVCGHNRTIVIRYTLRLIEKIEKMNYSFNDLRFEIQHQGEGNGNVFVGYKGVALARVAKIREDDLNPDKETVGPTGASRGPGFYVTPHFETALDFAKYAAICEVAKHDLSMLEPEPPKDVTDVLAFDRYFMELERFSERKRIFEQSDKWKKFAIIVRIYCKDFFSMHGCILTDPMTALPVDWNSYDYLEGQMQGGSIDQWEIKFNKKLEVYSRLIVVQEPRLNTYPNLPQGVSNMLEMAKEPITELDTDLMSADEAVVKP